MKTIRWAFASLALVALLDSPGAAELVTSGGGKHAVMLVENLAYVGGLATTTMTIPKGKAKHLLVVQVAAQSTGPGMCTSMAIGISVNDHSTYENFVTGTPSFFGPGATALGVVDLDQLEADDPGLYIGKPLEIDLTFNPAFADTCGGVTYNAIAQLVKK